MIIGAGAGGLTAASVAAESGADVVVLDERSLAGGQYYKQPATPANVHGSLRDDRQQAEGRQLIERAERSGAKIIPGSDVWGAFAPNDFAVSNGERSVVYRPKNTIVATGAYERALPMPGWTLPGVMTTGAAQIFLRSYGVVAGKRVLVAGNGPLNLQVALELSRAGATVVAVVELAAKPGIRLLWHAATMVVAAPILTANGLRYLAGLRRSGIPVLYRQVLTSVTTSGGGLKASICHHGAGDSVADTSFDADIVCMGYGFEPNHNILRSLGCEHSFDQRRGQLVPERSPVCETSVPGVFAVGDCCGLGGAPAACDEATLAAVAVLRSLGIKRTPELRRRERRARLNLRRHRVFQRALWSLYAAPRIHGELASADTPICRCENVDLRQITDLLDDDCPTLGTIKRQTRLGMGACQGRYCAPVVAALLAQRSDAGMDQYSLFAPRAPIKPVRISEIVKSG